MDNIGGSKMVNIIKAKEALLKSPEELESEKRHALSQRVGKLDINGLSQKDLIIQVLFKIDLIKFHTAVKMKQKYNFFFIFLV